MVRTAISIPTYTIFSPSHSRVYYQHQYPLGSVYLDEASKSGCYKASECFFLDAPRCVLESVYDNNEKVLNCLHTEEGPPFRQVNSVGVIICLHQMCQPASLCSVTT